MMKLHIALTLLLLTAINIQGAAGAPADGLGPHSADILATLNDPAKRKGLCEVVEREYYDRNPGPIWNTQISYGIQFDRCDGMRKTPENGNFVILGISNYHARTQRDGVTRTLYVNPKPHGLVGWTERAIVLEESTQKADEGYVFTTVTTTQTICSWKDEKDGSVVQDFSKVYRPHRVTEQHLNPKAKKAGAVVVATVMAGLAYNNKERITKALTALMQQGQKVAI